MKLRNNLLAAALAVLLMVCAIGYYWTRDGAVPAAPAKQAASQAPLVDAQLLRTARQMAALADTNEEMEQAREAIRLADHELDLAFSTALREAAVPDPKSMTAPQKQLMGRIAQLKAKVLAGQEQVAQLTKQGGDQLDFAKAQLELDQDDLDDAQQDLARLGGDRHDRLERALQAHEAAQQAVAPMSRPNPPAAPGTLKEQIGQWLSLKGKRDALLAAEQQASSKAAEVESRHNGLESTAGSGDVLQGDGDQAAMMARMHQMSDQKKSLMELDKRVQDDRQLAAAYTTWTMLVETRQRTVLHLLLRSLLAIFAIVLVLLAAHRAALHAFRAYDRRKRHLVEVASEIACQSIGVIGILLIAFGPPSQLSTILGLATAGLTVVLKDFIMGFIGWFVLMGRSGVRIGDWVEINGVGGEVIEIGVLKTVVMEMGNWSNTGHPTGRHVSFSNSYAIEGHYFNFSTVGQWLWDELQVTVPAGGDPYQVAEQIRQTVERETAAASAEAAKDWERVTHEYGVTRFSATPAVDLRPGINGLQVVVRYITKAPLRYEVKSKLFQEIVPLLHTM